MLQTAHPLLPSCREPASQDDRRPGSTAPKDRAATSFRALRGVTACAAAGDPGKARLRDARATLLRPWQSLAVTQQVREAECRRADGFGHSYVGVRTEKTFDASRGRETVFFN